MAEKADSFTTLQSQHDKLNASFEQRLLEIAQLQADKRLTYLQSIERLKTEASEFRITKRQLLDLLEHTNIEISVNNITMKTYLDKIVNLSDNAATSKAKLCDAEAELARSAAHCAHLLQEKELIERHNIWLNDELTAKINSFNELRRAHNEFEAEMSSKLANAEKEYNQSLSSLERKQDRVKDLESQLTSLQEDFCSTKEEAASSEQRFQKEVATLHKLVDLYKESIEAIKGGELEAVINVLEMEKDGEIERLKTEASEFHKSKRQLLELLEQQDIEISEKNITMKSYLDKIVNLSDNAATSKAKLCDAEAELARSAAHCAHLLQEKELIERHNIWLNDELRAKNNSFNELRRAHNEFEAEMSSKLANAEKEYNQSLSSLEQKQDRVKDLESQLTSLQEDLSSTKEEAASFEERFQKEVAKLRNLVDLYKESIEAKKAGELKTVSNDLEIHSIQVEGNYKEKLDNEISAKKELEKEVASLREKLNKCEVQLESARSSREMNLLALGAASHKIWVDREETSNTAEGDHMIKEKTDLILQHSQSEQPSIQKTIMYLKDGARKALEQASAQVKSLEEDLATLEAIQSTEEVREARGTERRNQQKDIKLNEKECAEAKKDLQQERDSARTLRLRVEEAKKDLQQERDNARTLRLQVGKELSNVLHAVATAEKAAVAEASRKGRKIPHNRPGKVKEPPSNGGKPSRKRGSTLGVVKKKFKRKKSQKKAKCGSDGEEDECQYEDQNEVGKDENAEQIEPAKVDGENEVLPHGGSPVAEDQNEVGKDENAEQIELAKVDGQKQEELFVGESGSDWEKGELAASDQEEGVAAEPESVAARLDQLTIRK